MKDLIKILMGRKLSKKVIEALKDESSIIRENKRRKSMCRLDMEHGDSNEVFKIIQEKSRYLGENGRTSDTDIREYNEKGLLVKKEVERNMRGQNYIHRVIIYNPPGRFFGVIISEGGQ